MQKVSDYVMLALILTAFAANSILNRLALKVSPTADVVPIDPSSFTLVRLISGAVVLVVLLYLSGKRLSKPTAIHYRGAVFLFVYAITFSYAYISLDAAIGALILFGVVQICIISIAIFRGKRLKALEWFGCILAVSGLLVLTLPHVITVTNEKNVAISSVSILLMVIAGIAWGFFTVNGAGSKDSLLDTSSCFVLSVPMMIIVALIAMAISGLTISSAGFIWAVLSGAVASGLGYALWYKLLPKLSASQASSAQLLVPIIAAVGGFLFLSEQLTLNFILATMLTLGGVLIVIKASKSA